MNSGKSALKKKSNFIKARTFYSFTDIGTVQPWTSNWWRGPCMWWSRSGSWRLEPGSLHMPSFTFWDGSEPRKVKPRKQKRSHTKWPTQEKLMIVHVISHWPISCCFSFNKQCHHNTDRQKDHCRWSFLHLHHADFLISAWTWLFQCHFVL